FKMAILAKYTDPRGAAGVSDRLPIAPVDVSRFAYRLPYAALDVSACQWCNRTDVAGQPTLTHLAVGLRDWDFGATESGDVNLSDEPNPGKIQPGAAAAPLVEAVQPALFTTPLPLSLTGGTGRPGDELQYSASFTNTNDIEATGWMLLRAIDPETTDGQFGAYHFGLDPETIIPDPTRALLPVTFMPVQVHAWRAASWFRSLSAPLVKGYRNQESGTPAVYGTATGTYLVALNYNNAINDVDPAPCVQPGPFGGGFDTALLEYDADGALLHQWFWTGPDVQLEGPVVRDATGNTFVTMSYISATGPDDPASLDLDPGPGTDLHTAPFSSVALVKLDPAGNFLWGRSFSGGPDLSVSPRYGVLADSLTLAPDGNLYLTGLFSSQVDFDPGPDTDIWISDTKHQNGYLTSFDAAGNWRWGIGIGGKFWGGRVAPPAFLPNTHVAVTGSFSGIQDFDPAQGGHYLYADWTANSGSPFLAEYQADGTYVSAIDPWVQADTTGEFFLEAIHATATTRLLVGYLTQGTVDVDFSPASAHNLTTTSYSDFIASYSTAGAFQWADQFDYSTFRNLADIKSVAFDSAGGVALLQTTSADIDIDPTAGVLIVPNGSLYWRRYTPAGALDWHHAVQESGNYGPRLSIDPAGPESGPRISVPEISWWEMPVTGAVPVLLTRAAAVAQEREDRLERPDDD
ncbi:MAG: hypothetical protein ABI743_13500, partial [bacterium]